MMTVCADESKVSKVGKETKKINRQIWSMVNRSGHKVIGTSVVY